MREYVISNIVLVVLDFIWLGAYMAQRYKEMVPTLQDGVEMQVKIIPAILAYVLMAIGLSVFVIPNVKSGTILQDSLVYGALFGIVVYGVYDFTALAVLNRWDTKLAIIDVAWGGFVYFCAAMAYGIAKYGLADLTESLGFV
jgi:uncharacterized membrane protein